MEYPVGIDIKIYFNLRDAAWHGRNALQQEFSQLVAVRSLFMLPFKDLDGDLALVLYVCGEKMPSSNWNGGVSWHELCRCFDARLSGTTSRSVTIPPAAAAPDKLAACTAAP